MRIAALTDVQLSWTQHVQVYILERMTSLCVSIKKNMGII